jgi:hypothetical protein
MIEPSVRVVVNLPGLERLRNAFQRNDPAIAQMFNQWVHEYSAFIMERFNSASRGDGTWDPLAPSTIYARSRAAISRAYKQFNKGEITRPELEKKLKVARRTQQQWIKKAYGMKIRGARRLEGMPITGVSILRDTGTLFRALSIGQSGNIVNRTSTSVEYGIGGAAVHPNAKGVTIGKLASYHQNGGTIPGRPPQRQILVMPPDVIKAKMIKYAETAISKIVNG